MSSYDRELEEELKKLRKKKLEELSKTADIAPVRPISVTKAEPVEEENLKDKIGELNIGKHFGEGGTFDILQSGAFEGFDPGEHFEDGFQLSDLEKFRRDLAPRVAQAILGTTGDVAQSVSKGFGRFAEGVTDLVGYGAVGVANLIGQDEWADRTKKKVQASWVDNLTKEADDFYNDTSILGGTSNEILEGLGNAAGMYLTAGAGKLAGLGSKGITALTTGLSYTSGMGSGMSEAYEAGASDGDAIKHGLNSGVADAGSELIFGGMGKGFNALGYSKGLSSADDMLAKALSSKIKSQTAKNAVEFVVKSGAEGLEEVISGTLQAISKSNTYRKDDDFWDILRDENLLKQFFIGSAVSGFMQAPSMVKSTVSGKDFITGQTQNEQAVIKKEVENRIAEAEKNGKKLTAKEKSDIEVKVEKDMERGYISTDTIESVLGGDSYKTYKDTVDTENSLVEQEKALTKEYNDLSKKMWRDMTGEEMDRREELKTLLPELRAKIAENEKSGNSNKLKSKLSQDVRKMVQNDRLVESYREQERAKQDFKADFEKYKGTKHEEAAKKTIESAIKAEANNTNAVHDLVDFAAHISAESGKVVEFKTDEEIVDEFVARQTKEIAKFEALENRSAEQDKYLAELKDQLEKVKSGEVFVDGNITGDTIVLNIGSKDPNKKATGKPLNRIIGHEVTHSVEKAKSYDKLRDHLFAYAKSKGVDIDAEIAKRKLKYEGIKDANPEAELVADLVGDYLFTDSDFVNKLSTENRNLAQRIYDEIKHLLKMATAGSKEARELERVKHAFENAFRESEQNQASKTHTETKYSVSNGNIKDYSTGYAYDEYYFTMAYEQDGEVVGTLEYGVYDGEPNVKMIEVDPKHRRKGIGTKLLQELQKKYDGKEIKFGMATPDGSKLLDSITYDVTDEAVTADMQKLKDLQAEIADVETKLNALYDIDNLTEAQEAEIESLGERWDELYPAINELEHSLKGKKATKTFVKTDADIAPTKYSLSQTDKAYEDAVNRGDMETAQKMVDEAAREWSEGNEIYTTDPETGEVLLKFYRSADGGRTVWNGHGNNQNQGVFLTSDPYIADAFDASLGIPKGQKSGQHITVYAKAENPFVIDAKGRGYTSIPIEENSVPNWLYEASSSDSEWSDEANDYVVVDYIDIDNLFPVAFKQGYDAVIVENVVEGVGGGIATDVVLKDGGKQMKSADPVTYDDDGNVIPLSQRFNAENEDIRYSLSDSKGKTLYTGSPVTDIKQFKVGGADGAKQTGDRYGRGVYLTTNKNTAQGYAGDNGRVYEINADDLNIFDLNDSITEEMKATLRRELNGKDKQFRNSVLRNFRTEKTFTDFESAEKFFDEQRKIWKEEDGYYSANKPEILSADDKTRKAVIEYTDFVNIDNAIGSLDGNQLYDALKSISTDDFASFITGHGFDGIAFDEDADNQQYVIYRNEDRLHITNDGDIAPTQYSLSEGDTAQKINQSMTMQEAKRMIDTAFKVNGLAEFYDGEYVNADDWLKKEGSQEVEMYVENDFDLYEKYISSNEDILNGEYSLSDVLDAYLAGTLTGKEKPKPKRLDVSQSTKLEDSRFYSPRKIEDAKATFELANQKAVGENKNEIYRARAEILLFAHNKGAAELLGITQADLNKKLRSWSNYSANARKVSERINAGVAEENRWTGIENSAYISKAQVTNEDIERLVASVEGDSQGYERRYIARVMLAADTHIDYSKLKFKFANSQQVNTDHSGRNGSGRVLGFYDDSERLIEVSHDKPNTVAHEMGHYIDAQWGRDLLGTDSSHLFLTRRINEDMVRERHGEQGVQFLNNFNLFINSLTDVNQNSDSYYNDRGEVFARFFAKFIEWTDNIATGNKYYSYESTMYKDNFTQAHYVEFAKLLQEKALLDGRVASVETDYSLSNEGEDIAPIGNYDFYGKDFRKKSADGVAVAETAPVVTDTNVGINDTEEAPVAPVMEEAPVDETVKRKEGDQGTLAGFEKETNDEKPLDKFDKILEIEKAELIAEYETKKADLKNRLADKNAYASNMAKDLYEEIRNLKKGVRASAKLGSLLDAGYDWGNLRSALANVRYTPDHTVNPNSIEESAVRQLIAESYADDSYTANGLDAELQTKLSELEKEATERKKAEENRVTRKNVYDRIIGDIETGLASRGFDLYDVLDKAHRMNALSINDNTPQRVNDKTFGYEAGEALNDLTFNKVALNETEGVKWLNKQVETLRNLSKKYKIKPHTKEAAAVQMYAEGFWVNEKDEIIAYGDAELAKDFPDVQVQNRIKALASDQTIRKIYDDTLSAINESRRRNGYPEIPRIDNYFLHYRAQTDTFSRLGVPFNPNDIKAKDLPTDINGTTIDRKPGQPFFASAMHREGKRTSFDVFDGLEKYLNSAKNQIYHIDDIQTARALWGHIAERYGQAHGLEVLDEMELEAQAEHIQKVYNGHLSNYARFLNEYANNLAGKTALIDRGVEGLLGRRALQFINSVNTQTGRNQVGYSFSSPLTNFIPSMEVIARTPKQDSIKAFAQTVANVFRKDGFVESDPTLVRRKGVDKFSKTLWEKMSDPGYILMGAVDNITSEFIVRTKYNELTRKGMDSEQAHIKAGEWAMRVMGDRSLGQMPLIYNSKVMGLITKYQLEVRNLLDSQFYDTIQEAKASTKDIENQKARNAKTAAKIASKTVQIAVLNHIFGQAFERIAGYNPAFDIVSTIATLFGWDDDEEDEDTFVDNLKQAKDELLDDLPYVNVFTGGGRIPVSSALPIGEMLTGKDEYGNEKPLWQTVAEAAPYYLLPGGYGQIKKTAKGLNMFSSDHPISGSYTTTDAFEDGYQFGDVTNTILGTSTDGGNLRYPVEKTFGNVLQAGMFGQYASKNARDYFDNNRQPLKEKQIQEFVDVDIPIRDYWEYRDGLKGKDTLGEKLAYIDTLDLPISKKNILANNQANRDEPIDMTEWGEYGDLEEFDYAVKYPDKYKFLEAHGISANEYKNFDDDTKDAYSWAYQNPEKYAVSKAVSEDVVTYRTYTKGINKLEADKDENGKSINGSRKEKVFSYIESLPLDYGQKCILFKSEYKSDNSMNRDILEYLDSREDISYDEMVTILTELGFTVNGNNVYWD